jgi:hypothetical protein
MYDNAPFTGNKGNEVTGSFSSDTLISFYIMSEIAFNQYTTASNTCALNGNVYSVSGVTHGSFDVTLPENGTYQFVFVNFDHTNPAAVTFQSAFEGVTETMTASQTYIQAYTTIYPQTYTSTATATSQTTTALTSAWEPFAGLLIVVIACSLFLLSRRHRRGIEPKTQTLTPDLEKQSTVTPLVEPVQVKTETPVTLVTPPKATMYCRKCGVVIPRDSVFCKECGMKVA